MVQVDLVFVKSIRNRLAWLSFSLVRTSIPRQRVLGMASFTSACPGMLDGSPSESKSLSLQEEEVRIGFIGAGQINFGAFEGQKAEGPWDHSVRLQALPGVVFTAVVDPNIGLAKRRIEVLKQGTLGGKWARATAFKSYQEMLASPGAVRALEAREKLCGAMQEKPDAVYIGVPPLYHGSINDSKADMELQLSRAGLNLFVEKPLSLKPAAEVAELAGKLSELQSQQGLVIAVGYMLRAAPAIQAAKELLQQYNAQPVSIMARYACAYSTIKKRDWWDTAICGGPIVEQATHFVDLMRFFGGDIREDSIRATAVGPALPLSDMPQGPDEAEHKVPMERRINRATTALFRFESGAVGSLTHTVLLHGVAYHTAFEILADGLHILIEDPYDQAQLTVRRPHSDMYEKVPLGKADMYAVQAEEFVAAIRTGDCSAIRSLYSDAAESYKVSQWITAAAESAGS